MKILVLYPEIMPYNLPIWRIIRDRGYIIRIVQLGSKKLTPFEYKGEKGIEVHDISEWKDYQSFMKANYDEEIKLLFVSEVINKWYWRLARRYHKYNNNLPVVLGSDAQWTGNFKNYLKKLCFGITYNRIFTNVLSAGLWQVVYALKIGFKRDQILTPLYCANNNVYYKVDIEKKALEYPKKFIFVGRLNEVKGIYEILQSWETIDDKKGWTLTMIGNGVLDEEIKKHPDIDLKPFMQQEDICDIMQGSGCALIPSRVEPWGLVIHEAVAAGLPIIVSTCCGATHKFAISGYNGYCIEGGSVSSLREAMLKIINSDKEELLMMSRRSRQLAQGILPEHVAFAITSLISE